MCFLSFDQCCMHIYIENVRFKVGTVLENMEKRLFQEIGGELLVADVYISCDKRAESSSFCLEVFTNYTRGPHCDILLGLDAGIMATRWVFPRRVFPCRVFPRRVPLTFQDMER